MFKQVFFLKCGLGIASWLCAVMNLYAQPNTLKPKMISYIPNTNLSVRDVHTDCKGNIVYTGGTSATAFKISPNTISQSYHGGNSDAFIVKVDSAGNPLWSTLIGGKYYDRAYAVEVDNDGFIYVAGRAGPEFQTTPCALQPDFAGDFNINSAYGVQDGFVAKITPDGASIVWSTYIGCDGPGFVRDIDLDSKGNIWVGVSNASMNFPYITANALQSKATATMNPALIKISSDGKTLLYGTFLSDGVATSAGPTTVRVDKHDNVYFLSHASKNNIPVTPSAFQPKVAGGLDFVISKFDSSGNLLFCSFLGGPGNEEVETHSLEIDTAGNAIVAAYTYATGYPVSTNAAQSKYGGLREGVITKIASNGSSILGSTYLGGSQIDEIQGIGVDKNDYIYVTGRTLSSDFPVTKSIAFQPTLAGGSDGHLSVLSPDLSTILYSTFIGGMLNEDLRTCHVDEYGKVYSGGITASTDYPIINPFDSFLTGTLTGSALLFKPDKLLKPISSCIISNTFIDPCLNTANFSIAKTSNANPFYPNPTNGIIQFKYSEFNPENQIVKIYSPVNGLIKTIKLSENHQINMENLPNGVYIINVSNRNYTIIKE